MSVLAPGLVFIDDAVCAGDEVFILAKDGSPAGVGRAKVDAATARGMKKGSIVRTRRNVSSTVVPGTAGWGTAVTANTDVLEYAESSAIQFVREVAQKNPHLVTNVSYFRGKGQPRHAAGGDKSHRQGPDALCRYRDGVSRNLCQC